ncbi:phosphoglycerate kinase [Parvularcula dongshanensis]|uniref:Phosphoglycerate kinase n=1 Tax=Parvularcula dongshanensis TaxID=1173995 RepID=A0A840I4T8_9PROT|nr:phosphoglycerate kinase [Parvularcula dongshanensis]MBB4659188.1 phosphoglycerate kinase [Parvularcula dongshanensis]
MAPFKTLDDLGDLSGKRVMVRVDFNVPVQDGKVSDATRLERAVPTVKELSDKGAKVILLSHFGRPKGQAVAEMSLRPVAEAFAGVLGKPVAFAADSVGGPANEAVQAMKPGDVLLLENTRFHAGEEANDEVYAKALAMNADAYVNDAFSAAHRAHASTEYLAQIVPAAAGRAMQRELDYLNAALAAPERPVMAIVGGAKVSTKLDVLQNLVSKADKLIVGGGMANTFLLAMGMDVGKSLAEPDLVSTAKEILAKAGGEGCEIILPKDVVVASEFKANVETAVRAADAVKPGEMILDLGPDSVDAYAEALEGCKTLVWNGPLGAFETPPFHTATVELAKYAAKLTKGGSLTSVAGGGDTVAALNMAGVVDEFTYVSTAGGAFLEWMEGKPLPGVDALRRP